FAWSHSLWAGLAVGGGLFGLGAFLLYLTRRGKIADLSQQVSAATHTLQAEFPDEVKSWGGPTVLDNPDTVRQLAVRYGATAEPDAPPALPPLEPGQRKALVERLRELVGRHADAAWFGTPRRFPFVLALLAGLLAGAGS